MLRLIVLWSFYIFLISAQATTTSLTQSSIQTSLPTTSFVTSLFSFPFPSTSTASTTPTTATPTTTIPLTTVAQGPVDQPASTTGTPGAPTPYKYTTIADGVTQVVTAIFTPTSPPTSLVIPTVPGTVLDYSSWFSIYGPTQTSSAGARYPLPLIPFTLLIMLFGILGGMLYV